MGNDNSSIGSENKAANPANQGYWGWVALGGAALLLLGIPFMCLISLGGGMAAGTADAADAQFYNTMAWMPLVMALIMFLGSVALLIIAARQFRKQRQK